MSKTCRYIILLSFISVSSYAQKAELRVIDSMVRELASGIDYKKDDTNKVKLLTSISLKYSDINADESLPYADRAIQLALKLDWKKGLVRAYIAAGDAYADKSKNPKALAYYDSTINTGEKINDMGIVALAVAHSALIYFHMGDFKKSLQLNFRSLEINEATGNETNIANNLNSIGNIYTEQGYYPKALEYHLRALTIFEKLGVKKNIAFSLLNIANIYTDEGNYAKALKYYNEALKIDEEIGYYDGIVGCYVSIGNVCTRQGKLTDALEYFQKALKIPYKIENKDLIGRLTNNIGTTYYQQKKIIEAIEYFQVSLQIFNEIGNKELIAVDLNCLGASFLELLNAGITNPTAKNTIGTLPEISEYVASINIPTGRPALLNTALSYCQKSLLVGREINSLVLMQSSYTYIAEAYKLDKNYKKALEYTDSALTIKDSIFSKENGEIIVRQELKNEYDRQHLADSLKRVQDIRDQNFKLQKQQLVVFIAIVIFVIVIVTFILVQRAKIARTKTEQQALFAHQLLEIELKALRAQMNPHFIFNSLNSIQAFILKENKAEASDYLQKFSKLIRMILDNSQKTSNTIEDEREILELYLDLEKLRLKNKFDFQITISGNFDPTFTEIPSMVIQPLVENSIWHGLMNSTDKGLLKVSFIKENNKLTCIVEDNGIGIATSKQLKATSQKTHESKGLKMVEQRLLAWSKTKGLNYTFNTYDNQEGKGTRTVITILYSNYA